MVRGYQTPSIHSVFSCWRGIPDARYILRIWQTGSDPVVEIAMKRLLDWIIEWLHYQQTEIMRAYMLQGEISQDEYVWKNLDYYRRYVDPWRER